MDWKDRFCLCLLFGTLIGMFVLVSMSWGHGEGKCLTDVDGNVPLSDDGWVKVVRHLTDAELKAKDGDKYGHGHRKQYYDKDGNPTSPSTEFFDIADNDEFYADCPIAVTEYIQTSSSVLGGGGNSGADPVTPTPATATTTPDTSGNESNEGYNEKAEGFIGIAHTHGYTNQEGDPCYNKHHHKNIVIVDGVYVYEDSSHHSLPVNGEGYDDLIKELESPTPEPPTPEPEIVTPPPITTTTTSIEKSLDDAEDTISEDVVIPEPEIPIIEPELCIEERVERFFWKGYTLYTPTVLPEGVETLADLWEQYWFTGATGGSFYIYIDGCWLVYRGEGDVGTIPLSPGMGVVVYQVSNGTLAGLTGCPVISQVQVELNAGLNLIGFPIVPDTVERPSDLLVPNIICAVIVSVEGNLKIVGRAGDPGDEPLIDGQGLGVIATEPTILHLETPAAPMAQRSGTLITSWSEMKRPDN